MDLQHGVRHVSLSLFLSALFIVVLGMGHAAPAFAHANGFATGSCDSCHRGGKAPTVTVTMDPAVVDPGASATVTVTITAANGPAAGFYLQSRGQGSFMDIGGQGTRVVTASEVTHSSPKRTTGADVVFQVRWTAPAVRGGYTFEVVAVSANGNGAPSGDGAGGGRLA